LSEINDDVRNINVWRSFITTLMWLELTVEVSIAALQIHGFHKILLFPVSPAKE
jgi:hypothetical protein